MLIWPGAFQKMKTSIFMQQAPHTHTHTPPPKTQKQQQYNESEREEITQEESFINITLVLKVQALCTLLLNPSFRMTGKAEMS